MTNLLATGAAWLAGKLTDHAASTVTYRRGGRSVSVAASKAPVRRLTDEQFGVLDIHECDWLIQASLLVLGGTAATPTRNDEITEADGTKWQVLPLEGEQEARPSDPFGNTWRIHTKRIAT